MANDDFDAEFFERRLLALKDSQDSIQSLSAWCLEKRAHHKKIVATWLQVLKKVKVESRLTLFYLANDVIQYSKRKNFEFVESWGTTLQRATTMVRDEKVKHRILRIFKIWDQRQVYDEEFLADLSGLIQAAPKKKAEPQPVVPEEFQAALLISTMRSCATLEQATDARLRDLRECNVDIDNAEELCASLKDRRHVEDAEKEVEIGVRNVENYVRALEAEIRERTQVLELLEQADQFYETQRGEVKIVTNAYRNFGSRVKHLKKKLDELLPMLTSPIPSPDINAPSPSPDSDIELPGEELQLSSQKSAIIEISPPTMYGSYGHQDYEPSTAGLLNQSGEFAPSFSSFMDGNMEFDMKNIFSENSMTPTASQQYSDSIEARQFEAINSCPPDKNEDFSISSFLKTVLPGSDGGNDSGGIPGLGDVPDSSIADSSHVAYNISHIPGTPINMRIPGNHSDLNNHQMSHSTPLPMRTLSGGSHTPSPYSSQNSQNNVLSYEGSLNSANPLPPPPMPPPIFLDDENCYNKLPPKFPTWTPANEIPKEEPANWEEKAKNSMNPSWPGDEEKEKGWGEAGSDRWDLHNEAAWTNSSSKNEAPSETPESPPIYEKIGFRDPIEYNDSQSQEPLLSSVGDVDHRVIPLPMSGNQLPHRLMKVDVDHRNLISLTGSPANHSTPNDSSPIPHTQNSLWSNTDQDYRKQVQPGDNVESVDMELSDDENEGKQKGRGVLVDVRSQDRDMRGPPPMPPPNQHMDMDMRMIPLPAGCGPQEIRNIQAPPPPPPLPQQFHHGPPDFQQAPPDFQPNNPMDFPPNQRNFRSNAPLPFNPSRPDFPPNQQEFPQNQQNFPPNRPNFPPNQTNFPPNHQNFPPNQQEFPPNQHNFLQRDFHPAQDFDYRENQHDRWNKDDSMSRGRFPQHDQHRDNSHRSDRGGRGRGFRGNRRDRYSDDHNKRNNRRQRSHDQQRSPPEMLPNNRPLLEKQDGGRMGMNEFNQQQEDSGRQEDFSFNENRLHDNSRQSDFAGNEPRDDTNQQTPPKNNSQNAGNVPVEDNQAHELDKESGEGEQPETAGSADAPKQLSEQLEALMNSTKDPCQSLKRSACDSFPENEESIESSTKMMHLQNGPLLATPNGPPVGGLPEIHPVVVFDYETQNAMPMFRPRMGAPPVQFSPWRGGPRGRGGFRGGPRPPWANNSPRGPSVNNFSPRKPRGGQFRGGGFRGRGRGNW